MSHPGVIRWYCAEKHMWRSMLVLTVATCVSFAQNGWKLLFDGRTLDGWMWSTEAEPRQPSWTAEEGVLRTTPGKGTPTYLLTRESFSDFEFSFEWQAERGANSGVKYRFQ